jgi:hypothetical protein
MILPKGKAEVLQEDVHKVKKAIDSMNEYTAGSKTSKHESNKNLILNAIGAMQGKTRSIVNLGNKISSKLTGTNLEKEGKSQIRAMLNPKLLLKYQNKGKPVSKFLMMMRLIG